jgi:hypothetical protein
MHCIDLLVRISDQLDFLIYDFSVIYYTILKILANLFKKKRYNQRRTAGWFEKNLRFSQKMLRGSLERGLIFDKEKVFFAKNLEPFRSGLRVDFKIIWGGFRKIYWEGLWSVGWFSKNRRAFLQKRPWFARSRPSTRPIEWPRKANDVATLASQLLVCES